MESNGSVINLIKIRSPHLLPIYPRGERK